MRLKVIKIILVILLATVLFSFFITCKNPIETNSHLIYFNSFESYKDLIGWKGMNVGDLKSFPAPLGGKKSIFITDITKYKFSAPKKDLTISISFWGKSISGGGAMEFYVGNHDPWERNYIVISDSSWKYHTTSEMISWPADSTFSIELNAGGILGRSMLIDKLLVIKNE
jgi:hypothetical protein